MKKGLEPRQDHASRGILSISNYPFSELNLVGYTINNNSYTWKFPSIDEESHFCKNQGWPQITWVMLKQQEDRKQKLFTMQLKSSVDTMILDTF